MQNLKTVFGLLMTSLVLLAPAASALPSIDLGAHADVQLDADVDGTLATVEGAVAQAQGAAGELQGEVSARADSALDETKAQASARASASTSAAQDAIAAVQAAFDQFASFASSIFASVELAARLG